MNFINKCLDKELYKLENLIFKGSDLYDLFNKNDEVLFFLKKHSNNLIVISEICNDNTNYHIIIIDGVDRNNCVKFSTQKLTKDGVIVFDNTQRPDYSVSIDFLTDNGFKRIDFEGLLPIVSYNNITTIFYRDNNCLGI